MFNQKKQSYDLFLNAFLYSAEIEVKIFAMKYLPLLVGVQQTLAFLFMLDPLENGENILLEAVRYRTDWHQPQSEHYYNTFWPTVFIKLLKGFESYYLSQSSSVDVPDFLVWMKSCPLRTIKSPAEERVDAIKATFPVGYLVSPVLYNKFSSLFAEEEKPKSTGRGQYGTERQPLLSSNQSDNTNCCLIM